MTKEQLRLVEPAAEFEAAYRDMMADHARVGEERHTRDLEPFADNFAAFVQALRDWGRGERLPEGAVPGNTYWLMRGQAIIGTARLRHHLLPHLEHEGGHIGYGIRPSERGRAYATRLLALALEKARQRGLTRVLATCDKDNLASRRVIENNGGRLEDERLSQRSGKPILRYWIDLPAAPGPTR